MTPNGLAIMLCTIPIDLRASFDGLARRVGEQFGADAKTSRSMYVFVNKRQDMAKVLWRDGTGWCLLAKRLDTRQIELPSGDSSPSTLTIDGRTLSLLLDGVESKKLTARNIARSARLAFDKYTEKTSNLTRDM